MSDDLHHHDKEDADRWADAAQRAFWIWTVVCIIAGAALQYIISSIIRSWIN